MRNISIVVIATIALAAPVVRSVRIDRAKASDTGTLLVDVGDRVLPAATEVSSAWPVMNNTAVFYTRQRPAGVQQLRLFDAPSALSRTLGTVPGDVVDLTQHSRPESGWFFILTTRDDATGNPSLAIVSENKGVLYREELAAPGTLVNGTLQVRRYSKEEVQRTHGDLMKAQPASIDPLALSSLLK